MNRISDTNLLILKKPDGETYVFHYANDSRHDALRTLGRFASNQELSFSWYDAAVLSTRIRDEAKAREAAE